MYGTTCSAAKHVLICVARRRILQWVCKPKMHVWCLWQWCDHVCCWMAWYGLWCACGIYIYCLRTCSMPKVFHHVLITDVLKLRSLALVICMYMHVQLNMYKHLWWACLSYINRIAREQVEPLVHVAGLLPENHQGQSTVNLPTFPAWLRLSQFPHLYISIWGLNPRFFHCFVDEDMMRWCKLVSRKSHRRTLEKSVLRRANLRLVSLAWRTKVLNKQAKHREEKTVIERDQAWTTSVVGRPCLSQTSWVNLVPRLSGNQYIYIY